MKVPRVFISYSHDSPEHKKWVLDLATRLRQSGIDTVLDQWDVHPGDDIPIFMERNLTSSDRVLAICTEQYVERANSGSGGVGYEKMILTADLIRKIDSNKIIPIIRQSGSCLIPIFLSTKFFLDFSKNDQIDMSLESLLRTLHATPLFSKPTIGANPYASPSVDRIEEGVGTKPPSRSSEDLCRASANGKVNRVRALLQSGENVNCHRSFDQATPLHLAINNDHIKVVLLLLNSGASVWEKDLDGITPFDEAKRSASSLIKKAVGRSLSRRGKDILGRTWYYNDAICPHCLSDSLKSDSGSDAAGTVWWSVSCNRCDWGYGDAH